MGSLLTLSDARALIKTGLTDSQLEAVVDREDAELVRRFGAHYVNGSTSVQETLEASSKPCLFLRRPATSVVSITEDDTAVTSAEYRLWAGQGRVQRLPAGSLWNGVVVVTYVPADDNDRRRAALIDLVRLAIERTAMTSESVAGEYSFQAPDWEAARAKVYRRMSFIGI